MINDSSQTPLYIDSIVDHLSALHDPKALYTGLVALLSMIRGLKDRINPENGSTASSQQQLESIMGRVNTLMLAIAKEVLGSPFTEISIELLPLLSKILREANAKRTLLFLIQNKDLFQFWLHFSLSLVDL